MLRSPTAQFLLLFLIFLAFGTVILAASEYLSREAEQVLLFGGSAALAGVGLTLANRFRFAFRKASQMLPSALRKEMEQQAPEEQYRTLCAAYETKNNEFNFMSVDRFLNHLLEDNSHTHAMENLSERVNSVLHSDTFGYRWSDYCLIYIKLEDYASYTLKNCNGHLLFDDFRRMYAAVHHAFSETLNERHVAHGLDVKEACVFLVNLAGTSEHTTQMERNACMEQLCRACQGAIERVADTFNVTLEVAVSIPYTDATQTHATFEWLVTMKEYCDFVYGPRSLLGPRDFERLVSPPLSGSPTLEKKYYSALLAENLPEAEQTLHILCQSCIRNNSFDISYLKSQTVLWLRAAETIINSGCAPAEGKGAYDWRGAIQKAQNLEELNAQVHAFFLRLEDRAKNRMQECSSTAQKIVAFLDKNYFFPDLSMTVLSEALSLSPSYISRMFKRETGQSIPDYIHSLRIAKAKSLLAESDQTIGEIAAQVGYTTAWTMNRAFKRYENMTPGAYRQMCQTAKGGEFA